MSAAAQDLNPKQIMAMTQELNEAYATMKKNQLEIQMLAQNKQKLTAQLNENNMVKQELDILNEQEDQQNVYKLVGPALLQQDLGEAKMTVGKRIKFLQKEIQRVEILSKQLEQENDKKKDRALEIQKVMQQSPQYIQMMQQMMAQQQQK